MPPQGIVCVQEDRRRHPHPSHGREEWVMAAVSRRWITDRRTRATRACLALLLGGPGQRLHALASQYDGPTAARPLYTPRPAPLSPMRVVSDVQRGRCGILPSGIVAPK